MKRIKPKWIVTTIFVLMFFGIALQVIAEPGGPQVTYLSNTTATSIIPNRSIDAKGTITTLSMVMYQQDYKWKAYVGNVTGSLALDNSNAKSIYDWALTSITGEVYATRSSSTINWANVSCVNQSVINAEETSLGITTTAIDSINKTFNESVHKSFLVGTKNITNSSCRAISTYINDTEQATSESAIFQEVLLRDDISSAMLYTAIIETNQEAYDGFSTFDFQMIVAENESATTPQTYYFYVELG